MTQAYPLQWPEGWPRTAAHRREYSWKLKKATFDGSRRHLYSELRILGAKSVVLSTSIPLRQDGQHYATMRPDDGDVGIAVYFELRGKQMAMARDCYDNLAQNLRSLSLAIEHLRGLDRHGGAQMLERAFAGFAQLPPPEGGDQAMAVNWREEFGITGELFDALGGNREVLAICEQRYKTKAKVEHSDVAGGSDEGMIRLNMAIAQARKELA